LAADVRISMDGKGRALDNILTERLWRTIKYEEVYLNDYLSPKEARQGLRRYLDFYNFERPHQSLDYQTPAHNYCKDQLWLKRFSKIEKQDYSASGVSLSFQNSRTDDQLLKNSDRRFLP